MIFFREQSLIKLTAITDNFTYRFLNKSKFFAGRLFYICKLPVVVACRLKNIFGIPDRIHIAQKMQTKSQFLKQ